MLVLALDSRLCIHSLYKAWKRRTLLKPQTPICVRGSNTVAGKFLDGGSIKLYLNTMIATL